MLILTVLLSVLIALGTFLLHQKTSLNTVQASCLFGVILGLLIELSTHFNFMIPSTLLYLGFGASFVGMTSNRMNGILVVLSGLIFGIIGFHSVDYFDGVGGTLGTLAGIAVCSTLSVKWIFQKFKFK